MECRTIVIFTVASAILPGLVVSVKREWLYSLEQVETLSEKELVGLAAVIGVDLLAAAGDRDAMITAIKASVASGDQKKLDTMRRRLSVVSGGEDVEVGPLTTVQVLHARSVFHAAK